MFSKALTKRHSENSPIAFSTAFTSKCVIQKGGEGFDNVSLFRTFIKAAAQLTDAWGRSLLKWCCLQPFVAGSASHLVVQRLSALPGPAGNPVPPLVFRKEGPAFSPDCASALGTAKPGWKLGGAAGVGGHRSVCISVSNERRCENSGDDWKKPEGRIYWGRGQGCLLWGCQWAC